MLKITNATSFRFGLVFLGIALASLIVLGGLLGFGERETPFQGLVAEPSRIDLGTFHEGQLKTGRFFLKNHSDKTVQIVSVAASCGCTTSSLDRREIAGGDSATLELLLDSSGKSGKLLLQATVNYQTTDPVTKNIQYFHLPVEMRVEIIPDYEYSPREMAFDSNRSAKTQVVFHPVGSKSIEIKQAKLLKPFLFTEILSVDSSPDQRIEVSFSPENYESDMGNGILIVEILTETGKESRVEIPVKISEKGVSP